MAAVKRAGQKERDTYRAPQNLSVENPSNADDLSSRRGMRRLSAWRESLRGRRHSNRVYRLVVALVGGAIVVGGLALVPLPGPGWVIVFVGLAILATEFTWAQQVNDFARRQVRAWTQWLGRQSLWVRLVVGLATFAFVGAIVYALFAVSGVPGFIPDAWVPDWPGL
jgi:uncharacterized protein (TIGR02611 family)